MQHIMKLVLSEAAAGRESVLVTVLSSRGSCPRGVGATMLVTATESLGTIGGGSMEYAAHQRARDFLFEPGDCLIADYDLSNAEAGGLGMVCGGAVTVLMQKTSTMMDALREVESLLSQKERCTLCRGIENGQVIFCEVKPVSLPVATCTPTQNGYHLEDPMGPAGRAIIFGGGHIAKALAPILSTIAFSVTVIDDRADFVTEDRFPTVDIRRSGAYTDVIASLNIGSADYVIIMTRGHESDFTVLSETLKTRACYIGCIGSRGKLATTKERLLQLGFTEEDFSRLHAPIGLAIGARTPEEIAVCIAGELIAVRAGVQQ